MPIDPERILAAIQAAMPANAEIQVVTGVDAINIGASWRLNDDPHRPNKMSKTISICVSQEAVQDFEAASIADHRGAYRRIEEFLAAKLASFDPQHDVPRHEPPPVEQWVISSAVLLGA